MLLILCSAAVALIVLWPTPVDASSHGWIVHILNTLHRQHILTSLQYTDVEFSSNILMFVPLGLLIALVFGPRLWWASIALCARISFQIEVFQGTLLPHRVGSFEDVVSNSIGGLIGALIAWLLIRRWARRGAVMQPGAAIS